MLKDIVIDDITSESLFFVAQWATRLKTIFAHGRNHVQPFVDDSARWFSQGEEDKGKR